MTGQSSNAIEKTIKSTGLIRALIILAAISCIVLVLWMLIASQSDPYVQATLELEGSLSKGSRLFRMNCAGCHGISGQGLVGPNLHEVVNHRTDTQIIHQVVNGKTPPMPIFELEPQTMADLLKYIHSIN